MGRSERLGWDKIAGARAGNSAQRTGISRTMHCVTAEYIEPIALGPTRGQYPVPVITRIWQSKPREKVSQSSALSKLKIGVVISGAVGES